MTTKNIALDKDGNPSKFSSAEQAILHNLNCKFDPNLEQIAACNIKGEPLFDGFTAEEWKLINIGLASQPYKSDLTAIEEVYLSEYPEPVTLYDVNYAA